MTYYESMAEKTTVTVRLPSELKTAADEYVATRGMKFQAFMAHAVAAYLEDEFDHATVEERRGGPFVSWEELKSGLEL